MNTLERPKLPANIPTPIKKCSDHDKLEMISETDINSRFEKSEPKVWYSIINNENRDLGYNNGGDEGIRTLDGLMTHTPLAGERLRPLGHVSERGSSDSSLPLQALIKRNTVLIHVSFLLTITLANLTRGRTLQHPRLGRCMSEIISGRLRDIRTVTIQP